MNPWASYSCGTSDQSNIRCFYRRESLWRRNRMKLFNEFLSKPTLSWLKACNALDEHISLSYGRGSVSIFVRQPAHVTRDCRRQNRPTILLSFSLHRGPMDSLEHPASSSRRLRQIHNPPAETERVETRLCFLLLSFTKGSTHRTSCRHRLSVKSTLRPIRVPGRTSS